MPTNNDYILRRNVLNEFHEWIVSNDGNIFSLADALEAIPATDVVEVKHGKWIDAYPQKEQNPMFNYGTCSVCGFEQSISNKLNFCPNCGAKMDAEPPQEKNGD